MPKAPAVTKLRSVTVAEAAAEELRRKIMSGEYPEGFQLKQDALAAEMGVSRIPIREALVQLEGEGLVRIIPHRGAVVSELSMSEISELFELRGLLEPRLLKKSAPRLTPADFLKLDEIIAEYRKVLDAQHYERWGELNTRLHDLLLSRAEQPRTMAIVDSLLQQTDRYTRLQLSLSSESTQQAQEDHEELVRLCKTGEIRNAAALLKRHIDHARDELEAFVSSRRRL